MQAMSNSTINLSIMRTNPMEPWLKSKIKDWKFIFCGTEYMYMIYVALDSFSSN